MTVDATIRYQSAPEGENFTFSLSKPLNELSTSDIVSADAFVGFTSFAHNQLAEGNLGTGIPENNPNHCWAWSSSDPFGVFPGSWDGTFWSYPANFPEGVYMRNILVYRPLNTGGGASLTDTNDAVRIVLEVTPDADTSMQKLEAVTGNNGPFIRVRYNNDQGAETRLTDYNYISPAVVLVANNILYLFVQRLGVAYQEYTCWNTMTAQGYTGGYQNFENSGADHRLGLGWTRGLADTSVLTGMIIDSQYPYAGSGHFNNVDFNGRRGQLNLSTGASSGDIWHRSNLTLSLTDVDENKDITKMYLAFSGCRFKVDDTWYKPIVEGGIVTGYTDDMTVQSEWDTWTKASGHNVPSGPPAPPPSPLVSDEQVTGGTYYGGGFLKIYACTKAELDHLQAWMSGGPAGTGGTNPTTIQPNMAPMQQMVGLTGFPIIVEPESSLYSTTFTFTDADNAAVNTGWTTQKAQLSAEEFYTGVLTVKTWEKDDNDVPWMDYSATVECYVPFCGVVGLDPQVVMGNNLKVRMWVDYITGDCSSYIECNSDGLWHPVAYMTGHVGASEAMSAAAYGQLMGAREANAHAMTQAVIGGVKNLVTGTINTATANYARGAGNYSLPVPRGQSGFLANQISNAGGIMTSGYSAMAAITGAVDLGVGLTQQSLDNRYNYEVAKNSLGTTIMGSFGSSSAWHFPLTPYIKVTYPTPMSKDVTNYGKTYGVPVHKTGTLDDYHGYTICNNVDTSGISTATSEEQALIKQFLESGVYLP